MYDMLQINNLKKVTELISLPTVKGVSSIVVFDYFFKIKAGN